MKTKVRIASLIVLAFVAALAIAKGRAIAAECNGDVDGDDTVTVDELVTAVNNALNGCPPDPTECAGDFNGDGDVTVNELVTAVNNALNGCPIPSGPNVFYVRARTGNDANNGLSPDAAFRTIGRAVSLLAEGDTIIAGPGVYKERVTDPRGGTAEEPVMILADPSGAMTKDPSGPVVLDASGTGNGSVVRLTGAAHVTIDGFVVTSGSGRNVAGIQIRSDSNNAVIRNCHVFGNLGDIPDGIAVQDSDDVLLVNNLIHDNARRGILIAGTVSGSQRARLINNTIVGNGDRGVFIGSGSVASRDAFLRNNIIQDNAASNLQVVTGPPSSLDGYDAAFNLVFPSAYVPADAMSTTDINENARFVGVSEANYRLSRIDAGETVNSPAVDAGVEEDLPRGAAAGFDQLRRRTTASDGREDDGQLDLGFHYRPEVNPPQTSETFYVRASGSDSNSGLSPGDALQHISRALAKAAPGDIVVVGPGQYEARTLSPLSGTASRPFVLLGDSSGTATNDAPGAVVLDAGGASAALRVEQSESVLIDGFTITGGRQAGIQVRDRSNDITIRNCEVTGNDEGIVVEDSDDILLFNNLVVGNTRHGIRIEGTLSGSQNARVINNTIVDNGARGITIGVNSRASTGALLQNNIVQDNVRTNVHVVDGPANSLFGFSARNNLVFPESYSPDFLPRPTDINRDALFIDAAGGDYRLSQSNAGQSATSPAVNAGDPTTPAGLFDILRSRTTATDNAPDSGRADLGYHYGL